MDISSYVFQSPYPHQFQIGRPDPSMQQQEQQEEAVQGLQEAQSMPLRQEAEAYLQSAQSAPSVNVAQSSTDASVSSAIDGFTSANNLIQGAAAYGNG